MAIADLPLLALSDITYLGAFRVPIVPHDDSELSGNYGPPDGTVQGAGGYPPGLKCDTDDGGLRLAFNPTSSHASGKGLFFLGNGQHGWPICELTIEEPIIGAMNTLTRASYIQPFRRIEAAKVGKDLFFDSDEESPGFEIQRFGVNDYSRIHGMTVVDGKLICAIATHYDANATAKKSHFVMDNLSLVDAVCSPLRLVNLPSNFIYPPNVTDTHVAGHTAGTLESIPVEWRAELGGMTHMCGQFSLAIVSRAGVIESAFGIEAADLLTGNADSLTYQWAGYTSQGLKWDWPLVNVAPFEPYLATDNLWQQSPGYPGRYASTCGNAQCFVPIPGTRSLLSVWINGAREGWSLYGNPIAGLVSPSSGPMHGWLPLSDDELFWGGSGNHCIEFEDRALGVGENPTGLFGPHDWHGLYRHEYRLWDALDLKRVYDATHVTDDDFQKSSAQPYANEYRFLQHDQSNTQKFVSNIVCDPSTQRLYMARLGIEQLGAAFPIIDVFHYDIGDGSTITAAMNVVETNDLAAITESARMNVQIAATETNDVTVVRVRFTDATGPGLGGVELGRDRMLLLL